MGHKSGVKKIISINTNLQDNLNILEEQLGIEESFDVVLRKINIGGKRTAIIFIDGFVKDVVMLRILESLMKLKREDVVPNTIKKLMEHQIGYIEVEEVSSLEEVVDSVLQGPIILLIDGEAKAIKIDAREYPVRGPEEPDTERVTRGARDGLVETIVFNTALIRRRIRDPKLRNEIFSVGTRSKTDVVVSYIKDIANDDLVTSIKAKIQNVKADALTMGEKSLIEYLVENNWNPLPKVKFTERPDVAAAHLLEGHIIVMVDTSPSVMILPATMFHFTQHAEDYYQNPVIGTYMRWIRFLALILAFILTPLWMTLVQYHYALPSWLNFIGPKQSGTIPILIQFIILELGIDLIRTALIHTPNALATSLGLLGAIMLGDFAVQVGLFSPEAILYMAVAVIGYFAIPNIEFAFAVRLFRFFILILTGIFKIWGLLSGIFITFLIFALSKSIGGIPYMWPLIPFDSKALISILLRKPIPEVGKRPAALKTKDSDQT